MEAKRFAHIRRENWVNGQPDIAWTVELYRADERLEALSYVEAIGLGDAAVVPDASNGYVVLAGVFESEQDGQSAIQDLPPQLRARVPRVRQFGEIKSGFANSGSIATENDDTANAEQHLQIKEYADDGTVSTRALNAPALVSNQQESELPAADAAVSTVKTLKSEEIPGVVETTLLSEDPAVMTQSSVTSERAGALANSTPTSEKLARSTDSSLISDEEVVLPEPTVAAAELAAMSTKTVSKQLVEISEELNVVSTAIETWTIVLDEASHIDEIDMSLMDHSLAEVWIHESGKEGKVRLLMGRFEDNTSAERARNSLPASIRERAVSIVDPSRL